MSEKSEIEGEKVAVSPENQARWNTGAKAAKAAKDALSSSGKPIIMMDELPGLSLDPDYEAMGWNSVWASQENSDRWKSLKY